MPLPKPWALPKPRILSDDEAKVLFQKSKNLADLEVNGLSEMVDDNIKRNRMTQTRVGIYDSEGNEVINADVHVEQVSHEFNFGCNAFLAGGFDSKEKNDEYERIFKDVFNQAVVPFYWKDEEIEPNNFRFAKDSPKIYRRPPVDYMMEFCEKTNCRPKGHNLVWFTDAGLPTWLPNDKREMGKAIDHRMKVLSEKYGDKIPMWDVSNEFTGNSFEDSRIPDDIDIHAWKKANELFYNDHLIINDYQCLFNPHYMGKMSAFYLLIEKLLANGIRIDGIGMQCHLFHNEDMLTDDEPAKFTAEYMIKMINTYSQLGKDIHISEITIPSYDGREEYLKLQDMITENMYKLWFSMEHVKSIVWWNLVDNTAIKASPNACFDENYFGGGLLKNDFTKKPAYHTVERLINHEWHTSLDVHTNEKGFAHFNGFNGDYELTIKKGSDTIKKQIKVSKERPLIIVKL